MFLNVSKLQITGAIWFSLSLVLASMLAGLVITIVVVARLTVSEMPWEHLGILGPLMVILFREAERNRKWFIQILDRFRDDLRELQAIQLIDSIEDSCTRDAARMQLALSLTSLRTLSQNKS